MASILVIDDDSALLTMFTRVFERFGFHVITAGNGDEGLVLFQNNDPELIVTDILMPGVSGNEIARFVKQSKKPCVPVIGISGTPWAASEELFDAVLSKPFSVTTLVEVVTSLVGENHTV